VIIFVHFRSIPVVNRRRSEVVCVAFTAI